MCYTENISFLTDASILEWSVHQQLSLSLVFVHCPLDIFHVELIMCSIRAFVALPSCVFNLTAKMIAGQLAIQAVSIVIFYFENYLIGDGCP